MAFTSISIVETAGGSCPARTCDLARLSARTAARDDCCAVQAAEFERARGIVGDRQVTPDRQGEPLHESQLSSDEMCLSLKSFARRNVVVVGLNLLALKDHRFRIGQALLETSRECHPCSRMEEILGVGGYNAMRRRGGITARIIEDGRVVVGDPLSRAEP
jgi:MOSC domain-containing protein YiiM